MATVIHNLQLNTETYARVRFYGDLPIMVQQKPIFQIFKKSNMVTVMAIVIDDW